MNIDGLGPSIVENLINNKLIANVGGFISFNGRSTSYHGPNGQEVCREFSKAIGDSKSRGLDRVLYGLGIRLIGSKAAGTIANVVKIYGTVHDYY